MEPFPEIAIISSLTFNSFWFSLYLLLLLLLFCVFQHLEVMIWCIRHQFLEDVMSRHANIASWKSVVQQRKTAARNRAWPDLVTNRASESYQPETAYLFITDALTYIDREQRYREDDEEELQIAYLQKDQGPLSLWSKREGLAGSYPFESLRAAVDLLFLRGSSDVLVSKLAIVSLDIEKVIGLFMLPQGYLEMYLLNFF